MDTFRKAVAQSVALSILLVSDYVPRSKPPPVSELVERELPRVLATVMRVENLGLDLERHLTVAVCSNPQKLLADVCQALQNVPEAIRAIRDHGHHDMVFDALRYTRKQPTATVDSLEAVTKEVANCLGVEWDEKDVDRLGDQYDSIHYQIIKV